MNNTITQTDSSQTVDTKEQSVRDILLEQLSSDNPTYEVARNPKKDARTGSDFSEVVECIEEMVDGGSSLQDTMKTIFRFTYIKQGRTDYAITEPFQALIDNELATDVFDLYKDLEKLTSYNIDNVKKGKDNSRALISYTDVASWKDKDSNLQLTGTVPILVTVHLKLDHKKATNITDSKGNKVVVDKDNKFQVIQEETTEETK
tara:strand:+ start:206 stop:817 length:612 start_codon:yes stop_codon:yes gene_type:complete